jgi:hypothetical protein
MKEPHVEVGSTERDQDLVIGGRQHARVFELSERDAALRQARLREAARRILDQIVGSSRPIMVRRGRT